MVDVVGGLLDAGGYVAENLITVVGLSLLFIFLVALLAEREEDRDARETVEAAGERLDGYLGEVLGATGAFLGFLFSIGLTIGDELAMTASTLLAQTGAPGFVGQIVIGVLAYAGLRGWIPLSAELFGYVFLVLTVAIGIVVYQQRQRWRDGRRSRSASGALFAPVGLLEGMGSPTGLMQVAGAFGLVGMLVPLSILYYWAIRRYQGNDADPNLDTTVETDTGYLGFLVSGYMATGLVAGGYYLAAMPFLPLFPWLVFPPIPALLYSWLAEKQEAVAA